ncbi:homeobox-like domain superfamily [Holotrichia oblita]|uniref:Homeobox-like domain superfamily n=1 Tax=Holotrichia oblita TaxID=644536 RepID=A0ACB9TE10_HOLOL|nr:homeobox-like domain superfamily [Holotrichia oblita]
MNAEPSTSAANSASVYCPPKKREKASHLSSAEKQTIIYAYKKIITDSPDIRKGDMINHISHVLGISRSTVYRVISEYNKTGKTSEPKKITGRPSVLESFDETIKTAVREIVHSMFYENELPTLDKVLTQINNSNELPKMSRSTLYRLMKQLNFK